MRELRSKPWIVAKGFVFLGIAVAAATAILIDSPSARTAVLVALLTWAACRFYYFLFHGLERYVDPAWRYAGLIALLRAALARRARRGRDDA
jgi:hypothetical protein